MLVGIPGWRRGLAPAFGPGRDPGDPGSNPTSGSWCMEPASPSACVSASLSLSLSLSVCVWLSWINKFKKNKKQTKKTTKIQLVKMHGILNYSLKCDVSNFVLLSQGYLAIWDLLWYHTNFRIAFFISVKKNKALGTLIGNALNLQTLLGSIGT